MKKLLVVLFAFCALHLSAQDLSAYEKDKAKYEKKIAKSDEEIADPKKGIEPKTWMNRGELFVECYELPVKNVMRGMSQLQIKTIMKGEKVRTDNVDLGGTNYEVLRYAYMKLYFDAAGVLAFWEITDEVTPDALFKAYDSYAKAYDLDANKKNTKKITEAMQGLGNKMITEASAAYNLGNYENALKYFEGSLACSGHATVNITDTMVIYNTGLVARAAKNYEKAIVYFKKSIDLGYEQEGSTLAYYAGLVREQGDTTKAMEILARAFVKYPKNQEILIGLINGYLTSGKNLSEVLPYIKQGLENEPNNASLYYAEGIVYQNLNDFENAVSSFKKATELNPNFFGAYYSLGALYYNKAVEIQNAASMELNDTKYEKMVKDMEAEFKNSIPYLTKAHELMPNERQVVESIRNIYNRFQEKSPEMKEKFEYYTKLLESM